MSVERSGSASVFTAAASCAAGELTLALTVPEPFGDGGKELLDLIASTAALLLARLPADD